MLAAAPSRRYTTPMPLPDDAITFTAQGNRVTLNMSKVDYMTLLMMLGYACGAVHKEDKGHFWDFIQFTNRLNQGNPEFTPYEIPAEK